MTADMTIDVTGSYSLPDTIPTWYHWRFCPRYVKTARKVRTIFKDEHDFRRRLDKLVAATCEALESAINRTFRDHQEG